MTTDIPEHFGRPDDEPQVYTVEAPPEPAQHRSEPDEERGRPLGQYVLAGGSAATLGGVGLFSAFGPIGLATGAIAAAGGGAAYIAYRARRGKRPGFKTTRMRTRSARSTSRLGSVGKGGAKLGRGKGPKLGGGRGPKLGKGGGPKLGKGGKLLGGRGGKLGGGKSGRLLGGKSGKLLGGGRGSKLGGKAGLGLGKGRRSTSRLGSVGTGGRRSGGGILGRGGKAGLGLGRRGGKLLSGKSKAGFGRWGKSTGGGANVLGRGLRKTARGTGRSARNLALRTHAGRKAASGFRAAKAAMTGGGGSRWSWFRAASKAARSSFRSPKNPFTAWAASMAAAVLALTAMGHGKWKTWRAKKNPPQAAAASTNTTDATSGNHKHVEANDPDVINPTRVHQNRRAMSGFPLPAAAAEMHAAAANYKPEGMMLIAHELDQFGEVPANCALAVRAYAMGMHGEKPIHDAVIEKLQELAKGFADLTSLADEIGPLFRQVHADDIKRFESPRVNEAEWDVSRNV